MLTTGDIVVKEVVEIIQVTRLNDKVFVINAEMIEIMEATPDTVITLNTGNRHVVKEGIEEVLERVIEYKKRIFFNQNRNEVK